VRPAGPLFSSPFSRFFEERIAFTDLSGLAFLTPIFHPNPCVRFRLPVRARSLSGFRFSTVPFCQPPPLFLVGRWGERSLLPTFPRGIDIFHALDSQHYRRFFAGFLSRGATARPQLCQKMLQSIVAILSHNFFFPRRRDMYVHAKFF